MYAIIASGGKQMKVSPGDVLDVELLDNQGQVTFNEVLFLADGEKVEIGTPLIKGASVLAKVLGNNKDDKVTTFKYRHKVNYHRTIGHRQNYTRVQIEEIKHGA